MNVRHSTAVLVFAVFAAAGDASLRHFRATFDRINARADVSGYRIEGLGFRIDARVEPHVTAQPTDLRDGPVRQVSLA